MQLSDAFILIFTYAHLGAAIPASAPGSDLVVRQNAACGIHFVGAKEISCGGGPCQQTGSLSLRLIVSTPNSPGPSVQLADLDGDVPPNMVVSSDFFQNGLQLVASKNTDDPNDTTIHFSFGGDTWLSTDTPRCRVGKPDNGVFQGDCSFSCT